MVLWKSVGLIYIPDKVGIKRNIYADRGDIKQKHICGDKSKWFFGEEWYKTVEKLQRHLPFPFCSPYTVTSYHWPKPEFIGTMTFRRCQYSRIVSVDTSLIFQPIAKLLQKTGVRDTTARKLSDVRQQRVGNDENRASRRVAADEIRNFFVDAVLILWTTTKQPQKKNARIPWRNWPRKRLSDIRIQVVSDDQSGISEWVVTNEIRIDFVNAILVHRSTA